MIDSTQVILPAEQAFSSGKLEMPLTDPFYLDNMVLTWSDYPINQILEVILFILTLLSLRTFIIILPYVIKSISRVKYCLSIDSNLHLRNDRNIISMLSILLMVLLLDKYRIINSYYLDHINPEWHCLATLGVLISWLIIRRICFRICSIKITRHDIFLCAHKSFMNFIIVTSLLILLATGIILQCNLDSKMARNIILGIIGLMYLLSLIKKMQILNLICSPLTSFLYICALEIIPIGSLVATTLLL